jgi:uroporphyrinogen-III decarboxylase
MASVQFWSTPEPLVKTITDVNRIAVPEKSFYEQFGYGKIQRSVIEWAGEKIALLGDCASATLAFHVLYRKLDNALLDFVENPGLVHASMEKGAAIAIEKGKFDIDTGLKMLRLNDSVANMSVISPQHWREFIFPHMKTVCDELHRYDPDVRIYCHICGDVMPIMDDLIAVGLDCIGPLDPLGNFTCAQARQAVGNRVALMGGVNTLSFINASPQELIEESRVCIEGAGRNGGYILGSGCVVPRGAPKDNLLALHEAAERFGTKEYLTSDS